MALVRAVSELRDASGMTNQELVDRAEMSASYYYARLRGDAPFDTNDIERLATALGTHPHEVSRLAASYGDDDERIEPRIALEPAELGRRLKAVSVAPRADGSKFEKTQLLDELAARGLSVSAGEWRDLVSGHNDGSVRVRLLEAVAEYATVPAAYLLDLAAADAFEAADAQLEFRKAIRDSGADSISARTVGDVSPAALRAIAHSLRSISPR